MGIFGSETRKDFSAYKDFQIHEQRTKFTYGSTYYSYVVKKYLGTDESVTVPEGVDSISADAFFDSEGVREIILPASLGEVQSGAFNGCLSLERIVFLGRYAKLSDSAFWGVPSPLKVVYPGTSTEWQAKVAKTTVSENSYDNGWGGGAPGLYSKTYTSNPMGHKLGEDFVIEAFCEGDGVTVRVGGTSSGGRLVSESTPYDD